MLMEAYGNLPYSEISGIGADQMGMMPSRTSALCSIGCPQQEIGTIRNQKVDKGGAYQEEMPWVRQMWKERLKHRGGVAYC